MLYYTPKFNTPFFCQWTVILKCTERYKSVTHTSLGLRRQQRGNVIQILRENTYLASLNTTLHWSKLKNVFHWLHLRIFLKKKDQCCSDSILLLKHLIIYPPMHDLCINSSFEESGVGIKEAYTCTRLLVYISLHP